MRTAHPDVVDRQVRPGPHCPTHSRSHGIMPTSQSQRPRIDISDGACEVTHQAQRRQGTRYTQALKGGLLAAQARPQPPPAESPNHQHSCYICGFL